MLTKEMTSDTQCRYDYVSNTSAISIRIAFDSSNWESSVDVEEAETVKRIADENYEGLLVEKGNRVHLAVADRAHNNVIQIITEGVGYDETMSILNGIHFNEEMLHFGD